LSRVLLYFQQLAVSVITIVARNILRIPQPSFIARVYLLYHSVFEMLFHTQNKARWSRDDGVLLCACAIQPAYFALPTGSVSIQRAY